MSTWQMSSLLFLVQLCVLSVRPCSLKEENLVAKAVNEPTGPTTVVILNTRKETATINCLLQLLHKQGKATILYNYSMLSQSVREETDREVVSFKSILKEGHPISFICFCNKNFLEEKRKHWKGELSLQTYRVLNTTGIRNTSTILGLITQSPATKTAKPTLNFAGRTLKVGTNMEDPYMHFNKIEGQVVPTRGLDFSVLKTLSAHFNFRYNLTTPSDGEWGSLNDDGQWTGMIKMVIQKEVDFAICGIAINSARQSVIDLSSPYIWDASVFVTKAPGLKPLSLAMIRPFSNQVWVALFATFLFGSFFLHLLLRTISKLISGDVKTDLQSALWCLGACLVFQGGQSMKSNRQSVRLFVGIWWLMALVLGASYSGTITSHMAIPSTKATIDTTNKLLGAIESDGFSCGAAVGTVQHLRMQDAITSAIKRLKASMYSDPKNVVISLNAGLTKALTEKYAFLYTKSSLEAELRRNWKDMFVISSDSIAVDRVGIAFQQNWPYQQDFNIILQRMIYAGLIDKWKRDVLLTLDKNSRTISEPKRQDARSLTLNNTQSAFYVLLIGYGVSSGILVMECIAKRMKKI